MQRGHVGLAVVVGALSIGVPTTDAYNRPAVPSTGAHASSAADGLSLTRTALIRAERARRLPPLRVPVRQAPEIGDDDSSGTPPGAELPRLYPPTPATRSSTRHTARLALAPSIGGSLSGLSNPGTIDPADVQLGVGPADVVEMVNSDVEIWSKTGQVELNEPLGTYFTSSGIDRRLDSMTDPRVIYDGQSGHWFASALDLTRGDVVMAISPTAQPGSSAWLYSFPSSGCQDQPRLGVSDSLVAIGANLFTACSNTGESVGGELTVLNKSDLLTGATVDEDVYGPNPFFTSITPVVSLSSTGVLYFAATDFFSHAVDLFATTQVHAGSLPVTRIPVSFIARAPDALQSDPALINTGDDRVQNAVWENGILWLAVGVGCLVTGEDGLHACGRFFAINTSSMSLTMDAGLALDQNRDLYYPAIMPTADGNAYAVFGYSSATETPSVGIVADPQQAEGWNFLTQGTGANESGRWGDYFGIARDPSDPTHVWVAAAYGTGGNAWGTTVAALGPAPFSITPPPPPPVQQPAPAPPAVKTTKPKHKAAAKHKRSKKRR